MTGFQLRLLRLDRLHRILAALTHLGRAQSSGETIALEAAIAEEWKIIAVLDNEVAGADRRDSEAGGWTPGDEVNADYDNEAGAYPPPATDGYDPGAAFELIGSYELGIAGVADRDLLVVAIASPLAAMKGGGGVDGTRA